MAVATYTKAGAKATTPAKLDKAIFGVMPENHQLLKDAYLAHLANARTSTAVAKRRGEVSGGGRKPWRQKGTGRARAGSTRSPLWRGGGITFGPTGLENHSRKLSVASRRQALRQALSIAADDGKLIVIEDFAPTGGKTKAAATLLAKIGAQGQIVLVLAGAQPASYLASRNIAKLVVTDAKYLGVYDVMNADCLVVTKAAIEVLQARLSAKEAK